MAKYAGGIEVRKPPFRAFHCSLLVVGLGAAFIDTTRGGSTQYYTGFALLFVGFCSAFLISVIAVLRPATLFMLAIVFEAYGWWNIFWSTAILWFTRTLPPNIALAQYNYVGVISIPLWEFLLSTALAIIVPIGLTLRFGKYARRRPVLERIADAMD